MRAFRVVVFKPEVCVYNANFKKPSQRISDSVSPGESQESALLKGLPKDSNAGGSDSDWNRLKYNSEVRK